MGKRVEADPRRKHGNARLDVETEVRRLLPPTRAAYVFWLYAPECLNYEQKTGTYAELQKNVSDFPQIVTEKQARKWLLDSNSHLAVKMLLERKNKQQLVDLHETFAAKAATGDINALKGLLELNKVLFAEDTEGTLRELLAGIKMDESDEGSDE